jgi:hypothetical protein
MQLRCIHAATMLQWWKDAAKGLTALKAHLAFALAFDI